MLHCWFNCFLFKNILALEPVCSKDYRSTSCANWQEEQTLIGANLSVYAIFINQTHYDLLCKITQTQFLKWQNRLVIDIRFKVYQQLLYEAVTGTASSAFVYSL